MKSLGNYSLIAFIIIFALDWAFTFVAHSKALKLGLKPPSPFHLFFGSSPFHQYLSDMQKDDKFQEIRKFQKIHKIFLLALLILFFTMIISFTV